MSMYPPPPPGQGPVDPRGFGAGPTPPPVGYPPMMPPPYMMHPPPPQPQRGGGWARGILLTLATTLFGVSLTLNLYLLLYTGLFSGSAAGSMQTQVLRDGEAAQTVAVVPVEGLITRATYERLDKWLSTLEKDKKVKAVVLEIDTPGGEVTASDQIYQRVRRFREDRKVPVVALMGSVAASGGYYVACAAEHVVAHPTTLTGSIGVRLDRISLADFGEKHGIEDASLHSTGADFKNVGSLWKHDTPEQVAYLQSLIDDSFTQFKKVVKEGRKLDTSAVNVAANGKAYTANQALALKLVDEVDYEDRAYAKAAELAGLSKPRVVRYKSTPSFFEALGVRSSVPAGAFDPAKLDRALLDRLTAPRLVYLWNGH